jgi:hypothetical protein
VPVQFDQRGAGLAEAAIVFGQAMKANPLAGRERSQARLALLGPGKHGRGVKRSLLGSAVAGRLAAAGLELVDRALDELTQREQLIELPLVLGEQRFEGQAQTAGAIGANGHGQFSLYAIYHNNIKMSRCSFKKMRWPQEFLGEGEPERWPPGIGGGLPALDGPRAAAFR